jgi:hypothetical protein
LVYIVTVAGVGIRMWSRNVWTTGW